VDEPDSNLGELRDRVGNLEKGLALNTAATNRIERSALRNEADTSELLELFRSARGGFKVLGFLASALKVVVGICAPLAAIWISMKGWGK
jgi:hypothetical protein